MARSITRDVRLLSSLTILLSALLLGGAWAISDFVALKQESQAMHERLLAGEKAQLVERVERAVDYINFFQAQAEKRLKETIRLRTYEACTIAERLVRKYRAKIEPQTMQHVVRDSLRHIRYNDGRGYFFAINVNGTEELFADKPHLEGQNLTALQDSNGQFVVQDMLELARQAGEGFYTYTWTKPGNDRSDNIKIAFVKYLPELDWVIGTGEYLEDVTRDLQEEVLDSLDAVYRDPDGVNYLFVGTWDGLSLSRPAEGKNMLEIQDSNGMFVVKELIKTARNGGGFVEYVMPKLEGERPAPKLSYVAAIPAWRWYIGTGKYIDTIDTSLTSLKDDFYLRLRTHAVHIALVSMLALLLNLLLINAFASKLRKQTRRFVDFFHQASGSPLSIDTSALDHSEFRSIGTAANIMLQDRNDALKELQNSEERFRHIFETNPDPLIIAKMDDGIILDVNRAFEHWSGIARSEAIGTTSHELEFWADEDTRASFLERLSQNHAIYNFEAEFIVQNDQRRTGLLSARLLDIGALSSRLTVIRDITTEKSAERALIQMDEMKSEFISTAAHELSTPLSAMMGFTEFLLSPEEFGGFTQDQQQDFLNEIYDRGEALNQIIEDLLDISRIERGLPITLELKEVSLGALLQKCLAHFRTRNPAHHYHLELPDGMNDSTLRIDRHRIRQVFENLLSNATKYTPKGGAIMVKASRSRENWQVVVEDQGIGMTQEQLEKVFDKFFRADASNTAVGGLGLGMSIARQIVEAHAGTIRVESTRGEGTRAIVSLPCGAA